MESNSEAMRIHLSTDTFQLLQVRREGGRYKSIAELMYPIKLIRGFCDPMYHLPDWYIKKLCI
jgi:hypothetical protein